MTRPLIIIPARMASTRLPGKPLADIHGTPMIVHVIDRAMSSGVPDVYVACAEKEIKDAVTAHAGKAVLTDPDLPSGTDRVWAATQILDPDGDHDIIINVQGDMPTLDPDLIADMVTCLVDHPDADMATALVSTDIQAEINDPNVVKAVRASDGRALYFSRAAIPHGTEKVWHHVGIYGYRRKSLETFCALNPSPLEITERLEQLRALENGMIIQTVVTESSPHGVDTPEDLERARMLLTPQT